MLQVQTPPTIEEIKQLAFQLSPQDLLTLITEIQSQLYATSSHDDLDEQAWLQAIVTNPSFAFLHNPEEDVYPLKLV
jgi:hypothetical protein